MPSPSMTIDDIYAFFDVLRNSKKFAVDPRHYLSAMQLLNLQAQSEQAPAISDWASVLAPIVCRSAKEQRLFKVYFDEWQAQQRSIAIGSASPQAINPSADVQPASSSRSSARSTANRGLIVAVITALIGIAMALWLSMETGVDMPAANEPATQSPSERPIETRPNATSTFQTSPLVSHLFEAMLAIALALGIWLLRNKEKRFQAFLNSGEMDASFEFSQLSVERFLSRLYRDRQFRRSTAKFRRHRLIETKELDAERTTLLASQNIGFTQPQYLTRQLSPEYLVLVDADDSGAHVTNLFDELIDSLSTDGAIVDAYYYFSDPRYCCAEQGTQERLSLTTLLSRHRDARLLILSSGDTLIHTYTGKVKDWVTRVFGDWTCRCIVTPRVSPPWGVTESALMSAGFLLVPGHKQGLEMLATVLENLSLPEGEHTSVHRVPSVRMNPFPADLIKNESEWLLSDARSEQDVERLIEQLKLYLGETGYVWLCACAIFPTLVWDITSFLGHWLAQSRNEHQLNEDTYFQLANLPWFKQGIIPNYLRIRLISALSPHICDTLRQCIETLLVNALHTPDTSESVTLGVPVTPEKKDFLHDKLGRLKPDNPLKDGLLINFLNGKTPQKTDYQLPHKVSRLLQPTPPKIPVRYRDTIWPVTVSLLGVALIWILSQFNRYSRIVADAIDTELFDFVIQPTGLLISISGFIFLLVQWSRAVMGHNKLLERFASPVGLRSVRVRYATALLLGMTLLPALFQSLHFIAGLADEPAPVNTLAKQAPTSYQQNTPPSEVESIEVVATTIGFADPETVCLTTLLSMVVVFYLLSLHTPRRFVSHRFMQVSYCNSLQISDMLKPLSMLRLVIAGGIGLLGWNLIEQGYYVSDAGNSGLPVWLEKYTLWGIGVMLLMTFVLTACNRYLKRYQLHPLRLAVSISIISVAARAISDGLGYSLTQLIAEPAVMLADSISTEIGDLTDIALSVVITQLCAALGFMLVALNVSARLQAHKASPISSFCLNWPAFLFALLLLIAFDATAQLLQLYDADIQFDDYGQMQWLFYSLMLTAWLLGPKFVHNTSLPALMFVKHPLHTALVLLLYFGVVYGIQMVLEANSDVTAVYLFRAAFAQSLTLLLLLVALRGWLYQLARPQPIPSTATSNLRLADYMLVALLSLSFHMTPFTFDMGVLLLLLLPWWASKGKQLSPRVIGTLILLSLITVDFWLYDGNLDGQITANLSLFYLLIGLIFYHWIRQPDALARLLTERYPGEAMVLLLLLFLPLSPTLWLEASDVAALGIGFSDEFVIPFIAVLLGMTAIKPHLAGILLGATALTCQLSLLFPDFGVELTDSLFLYVQRYDISVPAAIVLLGILYSTGALVRARLMGKSPRVLQTIWLSAVIAVFMFESLLLLQSSGGESSPSQSSALAEADIGYFNAFSTLLIMLSFGCAAFLFKGYWRWATIALLFAFTIVSIPLHRVNIAHVLFVLSAAAAFLLLGLRFSHHRVPIQDEPYMDKLAPEPVAASPTPPMYFTEVPAAYRWGLMLFDTMLFLCWPFGNIDIKHGMPKASSPDAAAQTSTLRLADRYVGIIRTVLIVMLMVLITFDALDQLVKQVL
ncbi:hypothetical protein [Alteromonas halophila]|uniref:Uncharacterized protein n=1 Tax=Alteromonas halophila TaxID=516698 RepID=A0A918JNG1_9ALTE|nr:hypothetical protein [Alteromonas halophila]GGW92273.1 hypothetical protein GCM10007391_28260 [Alteromonas halophila]